jgi:hypothetical protein
MIKKSGRRSRGNNSCVCFSLRFNRVYVGSVKNEMHVREWHAETHRCLSLLPDSASTRLLKNCELLFPCRKCVSRNKDTCSCVLCSVGRFYFGLNVFFRVFLWPEFFNIVSPCSADRPVIARGLSGCRENELPFYFPFLTPSQPRWPDGANFRSNGRCFNLRVCLKFTEEARIFGAVFSAVKVMY